MFVGGILRARLPGREKSGPDRVAKQSLHENPTLSATAGNPFSCNVERMCSCSRCLSLLSEMCVLARLNNVLTSSVLGMM